jgi:tetratricopeptide (TPR) repeat protein
MGRVIRHAKENTRELEELYSKGLEFLQEAQFGKAMIFGSKLLKKAQLYESLLLIGKAYSLMGFCCYMNNDLNQAMAHYETAQKSLSAKENIKGKSEELISVLNSLGTL